LINKFAIGTKIDEKTMNAIKATGESAGQVIRKALTQYLELGKKEQPVDINDRAKIKSSELATMRKRLDALEQAFATQTKYAEDTKLNAFCALKTIEKLYILSHYQFYGGGEPPEGSVEFCQFASNQNAIAIFESIEHMIWTQGKVHRPDAWKEDFER
jgi:hypothetical protein